MSQFPLLSSAEDMYPSEAPITVYILVFKSLEGDIFIDAYPTREQAEAEIKAEVTNGTDAGWFEIIEKAILL